MLAGVTCTTGVALLTRERRPLLPAHTRQLLVHYAGPPPENRPHSSAEMMPPVAYERVLAQRDAQRARAVEAA